MNRYLMVFLAVLLFSTAASAQTDGYIGLFADVDHTTWCGAAASIPGSFTMYIYCLPRADGTFCAEFMLNYPNDPTIITGAGNFDPAMPIVMGDLATGVSACYAECRTGWLMIASQLIITTSTNQGIISIAPHPEAGGPNFTECEGLRPIYVAKIFNSLYINYDPAAPECSETATAEMTWGAIKSMYVE